MEPAPAYSEKAPYLPIIPEGFEKVDRGRVYRSDFVLNPVSKTWEHPKAAPYRPLGCASTWLQVIRKA